MIGLTVFETTLGTGAIAWSENGIVGAELPGEVASAGTRLSRKFPGADRSAAPPDDVRRAIAGIAGLLSGGRPDLSSLVLDLTGVPEFERRVYEVTRLVPVGRVITYGDVARRLGRADARDVGQALARNPFPPIVPCHRVVGATGHGGFSAPGGTSTKLRLLAIEGAVRGDEPSLFDAAGG